MGEGFGLYRLGDDAAMMPHIDLANVACGFHASDPPTMRATVRLAKKHAVKVGAHPSLPDLQGFGRRAMVISPAEVTDLVTYQVGALKAFLDAEDAPSITSNRMVRSTAWRLAMKRSRQQSPTRSSIRRANSRHGIHGARKSVSGKGVGFIPEFYADLEYD